MIGIYKITSPTNRIYIGQSIDIQRRFRFYKNLNCKAQPVLFRSFQKHGVKNHVFEIIEECDFNILNIRERYWQDFYSVLKGGLNCNLVATDILPKRHSEDTKIKISKSNIGKIYSEKTKNKMSISGKNRIGKDNSFYGKKHTKEFKINRSIKRSYGGNPKARLVLNIETGIYYSSLKEAAETVITNYVTLKSQVSGLYKNKSNFIYVDKVIKLSKK